MAAAAAKRLPRCIVFDLDGTLWDPEMYQLWGGGGAPFRATSRPDVLLDAANTQVRLYDGVLPALQEVEAMGCVGAIASSTDEPAWARECLEKFLAADGLPLKSKFPVVHIYKGSKRAHLRAICEEAGFRPTEVLFIDNEMGNIRTVHKEVGVPSYHCPRGLTLHAWRCALDHYSSVA